MTVADYLNDLATRYASSDVQLGVAGNNYSATDLLDGLGESDKIREGLVGPETLVRYRDDAEWVELSEFLNEWMRRKATIKQIDYLEALQRQHGIVAEIPLDLSREEISMRINELAPRSDF